MLYLNLVPGFHPVNRAVIDLPLKSIIGYSKFKFPGGEPHIKLDLDFDKSQEITITTRMSTMDDLMFLLLATDALRRARIENISVFISYLPFARQDRVMEFGEPLSLKVIADIINSQNYKAVGLFDVHSDTALALINHSQNESNHMFVNQILKDKINYKLVCPDAGAYKKIFKLAQVLEYKDTIVMCNKIRNLSTGKIVSTQVINDNPITGGDYFIVDDICDGGATFIAIAEELHKTDEDAKVNLIVTHGIFSKGYKNLLFNGINHLYTTDSIEQKDTDPFQSSITIINL